MKSLTDDDIVVTRTQPQLLPKGAAALQRALRRRRERLDLPLRQADDDQDVHSFEEHDRAAE